MKQPAPVNPYLTPASDSSLSVCPTLWPNTHIDCYDGGCTARQSGGYRGPWKYLCASLLQPETTYYDYYAHVLLQLRPPPPTPFVDEELMELDDELEKCL